MKRLAWFFALLGAVGCTHGLVREPVEQVTLPGGLEVRWRSLGSGPAGDKASPLVLTLRSVGAGPVVLCQVLRTDGTSGSPGAVFVRRPARGRFRYDPASDSVVALSEGGSPFSLAPAFLWYDQVLYPGGEGASVNVGEVSPGATARVLVEYLPLSYLRLSWVGYAQSVGAMPAGKGDTGVRFRSLSEALLRQKRPRELFLWTESLAPVTRVPLEIPWSPRQARP
jgi:hypothetical protein